MERQRLLDGLAESIAADGYRSTTVADIVRRAHTSRRTFYAYFSDKEACFVALLTDSPQTAIQGADAAIASTSAASVVDALVAEPPSLLIDLDGRLGDEIEALPGYRGAGWWSAPG